MSFMDDYEADLYWDEQEQYMEHEYSARIGVWHTKDGKELKIKDMETSHIKNCIAFIRRNDKIDMYEPYIKVFEKELKRRQKMTRAECEKAIAEKMKEIVDIVHQYNPECKYLGLCYNEDIIFFNNEYFNEKSSDSDFPIDHHEFIEEDDAND